MTNQRLQGAGAQQKGGEQQAHPEMGLPEQGAPGKITESLHRGLQTQKEQSANAGGSPEQAMPDHPARQQTPEAEQHGASGEHQTQGTGGPKAVAQADQHGHHNTASDPGPMLRVLQRHCVGDRVDVQPLLPSQDSQPDRGAHHRVDEQDDQHGVDEPQPVMAGERLQCLGISQKKTQP